MRIPIKTTALLLLACCISGLAGGYLYSWIATPSEQILTRIEREAIRTAEHSLRYSPAINRSFSSSVPTDFIEAAKSATPAVVFVRAMELTDESTRLNRVYNSSSGSGVIISRDGYIVTNKHVIDGADKIEITLNDNREYLANLIGSDASTDLAVIKINLDDAPYLTLGDSDLLQVGEWVLAVGNPLQLSSTVTAGIVSAKSRSIDLMASDGIESFIQTDAAVNPGNSGGALVNTAGKLIGINTAILSKSGGYEGFSFAVPINLAKKIVNDLIEYGAVQRGWMGVMINNVDADIAQYEDLETVSGVILSGFSQLSAAKEAGLVVGDIVLAINGRSTASVPEFTEQVGQYRPGDKLTVNYLRDNQLDSVVVILRNNLNSTDFVAVRKDKILTDLGLEIRDMDSAEQALMQIRGAYVVSVYQNSVIGRTNLEPGFIITMANETNIQSAADLVVFLRENKGTVELEGYYQNYPGKYPYSFENK